MIAPVIRPERKVRTLQGRVVRNANAGRPGESATENKPPDFPSGKGETARQELTASMVTWEARQTPPRARPNREMFEGGPSEISG